MVSDHGPASEEPDREETGGEGEARSPKWEPPGPPADGHRERAFEFPGTNRRIGNSDRDLVTLNPRLSSEDPGERFAANLEAAAISEWRATLHEAAGQSARAAADRRGTWTRIEAAHTNSRLGDIPPQLAAACHGWQAKLLAEKGDWPGSDAQLDDHGYPLLEKAVAEGQLHPEMVGALGWVMGQPVAEVAIDSGRPAMALERLDGLRSLFGEPPLWWESHYEFARFAAETATGEPSPETIQEQAGSIAQRFGVGTPSRAWWAGATHLLAASRLLARGETARARLSLDVATWPVRMGTSGLGSQPGRGLRLLLEWGHHTASPGPALREDMTAIMEGLDRVGAAREAKGVETWLRKETPEPPPLPVSMAYLGDERNGRWGKSPWAGD